MIACPYHPKSFFFLTFCYQSTASQRLETFLILIELSRSYRQKEILCILLQTRTFQLSVKFRYNSDLILIIITSSFLVIFRESLSGALVQKPESDCICHNMAKENTVVHIELIFVLHMVLRAIFNTLKHGFARCGQVFDGFSRFYGFCGFSGSDGFSGFDGFSGLGGFRF